MSPDANPELRRESFNEKNVRFLGYKFLQGVVYNGEPVVPVIMGEGTDAKGKYFNVEKLGGRDFDIVQNDPGIPLSLKLDILSAVAGQFKEIDKAGFVAFDRRAKNIRVLSTTPGRISVRQIDMEDIYDKRTKAFYTERWEGPLGYRVGVYEQDGVNMWCSAVSSIAEIAREMMNGVQLKKYQKSFSDLATKTSWYHSPHLRDPIQKQDVLSILSRQLQTTAQELRKMGS